MIDTCTRTCVSSSAHPTIIATFKLIEEKLAKGSEKTPDWLSQSLYYLHFSISLLLLLTS